MSRRFYRFSLYLLVLTLAILSTAQIAASELRQELIQRRAHLSEQLSPGSLLILFSGPVRPYSGDVSYEYRQENNFYYLTGIDRPEATLVMVPSDEAFREILFLPERDPGRELWTGPMLSPEEATEISGIEEVWKAGEFKPFIEAILQGIPYRTDRYQPSDEYNGFFSALEESEAKIYLLLKPHPGLEGRLSRELEFADRLRARFPGVQVRDVFNLLTEMRLVKSQYEISQLETAVDITAEALRNAIQEARPGVWEYEVEATIEYVFKRNNSADWGFPSIVASGPNATVLHYEASQRQTCPGELLLMDVGAEWKYYSADITRTIPLDGNFTREQLSIYELVLRAQQEAGNLVQPGASIPEVHQEAVKILKEGLLRLGLITDPDSAQYRVFFPHGIGHWLGMDVHDVGGRSSVFQPGMVLTVEPGIYIRENSIQRLKELGISQAELEKIKPAVDKYLNIGVRIEDVYLVTAEGHEILSDKVPNDPKELTSLMQTQ